MKAKKLRKNIVFPVMLMSLLLAACSDKPDALIASAKGYLAKKDTNAAVIQIKNALQSDPELPEARYLLGTTLLENGDAAGAEAELRKALALKYSKDAVVPQLAKALLAQGHSKKLTDEWARAELLDPGANASLQMLLTAAYAQQNLPDLSKASLAAALQADPEYAPARLVQARQKAIAHDQDGAKAMVDEIIAKSPNSYEAWKFKGDLMLTSKDPISGALEAYRKSVEINPDYLAGHGAVTAVLLQQGNLSEAETQLLQMKRIAANHPHTKYLEAQLAFQKRDFKAARELVQQVLQVVPSNAQGLQLAGAVEMQFKSWSKAEIYLEKALQLSPDLMLARRALVMSYLRSGQPEKAIGTLLPGLEKEHVDPALLSLAGEVYMKTGDVAKAQGYFKQAALTAPNDPKKRTSLALSHLINGEVDGAFEELQDIAGSDTGTSADLALISAHFSRQEYDKALGAIDALERKQPTQPVASHLRGRILLARGDRAGARTSFERSVALVPDYFPAVASLAALDMIEKRPDGAKKRFEVVLAKIPKHGQALLALVELAMRTGAPRDEVGTLIANAVSANPTDSVPRLLQIDFYLHANDVKAATSAAQSAAAALPDNPDVLDALGRTQRQSGDLNQALVSFNKLAVMQPQSPRAQLRIAETQMGAKDRAAAAGSLLKALEIKPNLLEAQRALIGLALEAKKAPDALAIARSVQKQRPQEAVGFGLEGDIYASQKNWDSAATAYRSGLKPAKSPELAVKLHSVLRAGAKDMDADKFSTTWQKDNPKDVVFLLYEGELAIGRKDYVMAEKRYAGVVALQPDNAVAYNNLAWVSARLKKGDPLALAEKANALAPNQPAFMDTWAMLLSDKGDHAKAVELQNKALALQPANAMFKLNLVKIHLKGGQKDLAKIRLDELAKLGSEFSAQAEVTALLTALK